MRNCTECGAAMREGYVIDDGAEYYCGDVCLHENYLAHEWDEMYADGEGNSYWTTWEEETDLERAEVRLLNALRRIRDSREDVREFTEAVVELTGAVRQHERARQADAALRGMLP
jgi:hypothetical protein